MKAVLITGSKANTPVRTNPLSVEEGGTGGETLEEDYSNLGVIPANKVNQPNGVAGLDNHGDIFLLHLPSVTPLSVSITGPSTLKVGESGTYTINNYSNFVTYGIADISGNVIRDGATIVYTAPNVVGTSGFIINKQTISIEIMDYPVNTPSIVSPLNNDDDLGVSITFTASPLDMKNINVTDNLVESYWEISKKSTFPPDSTTIKQTVKALTNTASWLATGLEDNTVYYVRVKLRTNLKDSQGEWNTSNWSSSIRINTGKDPIIAAPVISITNLPTINHADGSMVSIDQSPLTMVQGIDRIQGIHRRASTIPFTQTNGVWDSEYTDDVVHKRVVDYATSIKNPWTILGIKNGLIYYQIRYLGSKGEYSPWSNMLSFTLTNVIPITKPSLKVKQTANGWALFLNQDMITTPANKDTLNHITYEIATSPTFSSESMVFVGYTRKSAQSLITEGMSLSYLEDRTTYYIRAIFVGNKGGYSDYSDTVTFTTGALPRLVKPSIVKIEQDTTNVEVTNKWNFYASNFAVATGNDSHEAHFLELYYDQQLSGSNIRGSSSIENAPIVITGLLSNTTYYAILKYKGKSGVMSEFSDIKIFTTPPDYSIDEPSILSPDDNYFVSGSTITITGDTYQVNSNAINTQTSSTWQLSRNSDFTDLVHDVTNDTNFLTTWTITGLVRNLNYYFRAKHNTIKDTVDYSSPWSLPYHFNTIDPISIKTPTFTFSKNAYYTKIIFNISTVFTLLSGVDTYRSITIQLSKKNFTDVTFNANTDLVINEVIEASVLSVERFPTLDSSTTYYGRVRYTGNSNTSSAWSATKTLITPANVVHIVKPVILTPTNNQTNVPVDYTFSIDTYTTIPANVDTLASAEWQLTTTDFNNPELRFIDSSIPDQLLIDGLESDTIYKVRVRLTGSHLEISPWSDEVSFHTA